MPVLACKSMTRDVHVHTCICHTLVMQMFGLRGFSLLAYGSTCIGFMHLSATMVAVVLVVHI